MQTVITADVVNFDVKQKFDRVVSVEMFEHCKNYQVPVLSCWEPKVAALSRISAKSLIFHRVVLHVIINKTPTLL